MPVVKNPYVDVWIVRWEDYDASRLEHVLNDHERARAKRFTKESARSRFVIARGLLRQKLADELRATPEDISIAYSTTGKPSLEAPGDGSDLRFCVSHADELGLIGLGRSHAIGVDIERRDERIPIDRLANRFFTPLEAAFLQTLDQCQRHEAFCKMWTAKEALIKAQGEGVPSSLRRYAVDLHDDGSVSLATINGDDRSAHGWRLETVPLDDDHIAAVAINTPDARIRWHRIVTQAEESESR